MSTRLNTSLARKQKDVERNLALYRVILAFRAGKLPTNIQLHAALDAALNHALSKDNVQVSREGERLFETLRELVVVQKQMLEEKNFDQLFQRFIHETANIDLGKVDISDVSSTAKVHREEVGGDGKQSVHHLRTLTNLVLTNSEARKLVNDVVVIARDILADATVSAAETLRPSEHELKKTHEAAPSNQWESPSNGNGSVAQKVSDFTPTQEELRSDKPLLQKIKDNVPDGVQDNAKANLLAARDFISDRLPESRREQFVYRLKKMVVENQQSRQYQDAIEFFIERAERYNDLALDLTEKTRNGADGAHNNFEALKVAEQDLQLMIERFANHEPLQPVFDAITQIYTDVRSDEHLKRWFGTVADWVKRALREPGYLTSDASEVDRKRIMRHGEVFWNPQNGKYAGRKDHVLDSMQHILNSFANDHLNHKLGELLQNLVSRLLLDQEGEFTFKPELLDDIKFVIIPAIVKQVGWIPIPRIEYSDKDYDLVLEDFAIDTNSFLSIELDFEAYNFFKLGFQKTNARNRHSVTVSFSQIHVNIQDLVFYFKQKTGFLKISETGVAGARLSGKGVYGTFRLESSAADETVFEVKNVKTYIDALELTVQGKKHPILLGLAKPFIAKAMKKQLASTIQERLRLFLVEINGRSVEAMKRVKIAQKTKGDDAPSKVSIVSNFVSDVLKGKKDKVAGAPKPFTISSTKTPDLVGWRSSATSVSPAAAMVEDRSPGWESPAFDVFMNN